MKVASFDSSVYMSEDLNKKLLSVAQDLAIRSIEWAAQQYSFDANEALRMLNLSSGKIESKKQVEKKPKEVVVKPSFPLPYNGEHSESCCQALRQNNGLYTQCQSSKKTGSEYCKSCDLLASKSEGIPEYGTIKMRLAVDIQEYVDPKGRKPVSYTKVMKKFKVNEEQVMEEAGKFNITMNPIHFEVAESDTKRGRPKAAAKAPKEPKGAKGRPKKEKKVLAIEGEEEDLFATLVANASINEESSDDEEIVIASSEKLAKKQQDEEAKAAKALKKQQEEEARALKKQQEEEAKAAKAIKKQQEEEARALKKQQEEAEKAEKAALKEQERIAKEEAKALKKQEEEAARAAKAVKSEKSGKAAKSSKKEAEDEDEQPDVVKKIEFEGKKYLKSKKTGIIYDYNEYVQNQEQLVVGKWNESKNKIEFTKADSDSEEEEEDYDE
jgi:hypothetical protein